METRARALAVHAGSAADAKKSKNVGVFVGVGVGAGPEVGAGPIGAVPVTEHCEGASAGLDVGVHPSDLAQPALNGIVCVNECMDIGLQVGTSSAGVAASAGTDQGLVRTRVRVLELILGLLLL